MLNGECVGVGTVAAAAAIVAVALLGKEIKSERMDIIKGPVTAFMVAAAAAIMAAILCFLAR